MEKVAGIDSGEIGRFIAGIIMIPGHRDIDWKVFYEHMTRQL
jgi:hypothetical protein